jgi:hypothetical protein
VRFRKGTGVGDEGARAGGLEGPLNLIHRNKVPNPVSMRVSGRFDFPDGASIEEVQKTIDFAFGPLGWLMRRRANGP